jgi:WD40 repeat protein
VTIPVWQPGHYYAPGDVVIPTAAPAIVVTDIDNGNFDAGDVDWTKGTGWSIATDRHFNGTHSAKFNNTGTAQLVNDTARDVLPGTSVTINGVVDQGASSSGQASAALQIVWLDAADVVIDTTTGTAISSGNDGTWKAATVTGVAPAGTAKAKAAVTATRTGGSEALWVDNLTWNVTAPDRPTGLYYRAVQPEIGASAANEPAWPIVNGQQVVDNDVIWEAVTGTRVEWTAYPILKSGDTEPDWPLENDALVEDNTIAWKAITQRITDPKCPHGPIVTMGASKIFCANYDIVNFCATNNARDWSSEGDAGYLPVNMQEFGANDVRVLNIYRGNLVVMSSEVFQMWQIDPDPALMSIIDSMPAIGSTYHEAAMPVAGDLLYLPPLGVRSVGIAGGSTNLDAGDVGKPVDPLVREALAAANAAGERPLGLYYPAAGQYWLVFNTPDPTPEAIPEGYVLFHASGVDDLKQLNYVDDTFDPIIAPAPETFSPSVFDIAETFNGDQIMFVRGSNVAIDNKLFHSWAYIDGAFVPTNTVTGATDAGLRIDAQDGGTEVATVAVAVQGTDPARVFTFDGDDYTEVVVEAVTCIDNDDKDVALSPDATLLACAYVQTAGSPTTRALRLYERDEDGDYVSIDVDTQLATGGRPNIAFSSDGTHLAYATDVVGYGLKVFKVSEGSLDLIFSDAACQTPDKGAVAYSQDGLWLAVSSGSFPGTLRLYSIDGDTYTLESANALSAITGLEYVFDAKFYQGGDKLIVSVQVTAWANRVMHIYNVGSDGALAEDTNVQTEYDASSFDTYSYAAAASPLVVPDPPEPITGTSIAYVFDIGSGTVGKWCRYEFPFRIDAWTLLGDDLVLRADDSFVTVDDTLFTDAVWNTVESIWTTEGYDGVVWWPWLDFGTPGADKEMVGIDMIASGLPTVDVGYDQKNKDRFGEAVPVPDDTLYDGPVPYEITAPTLSIRITFSGGTAWKLNAVNVYFAK